MTETLSLNFPKDPVKALALRRWAAEKGIELVEMRQARNLKAREFPYVCRHGHTVTGETDLKIKHNSGRIYRYCLQCYRVRTARQKQKYRVRYPDRQAEFNERRRREYRMQMVPDST